MVTVMSELIDVLEVILTTGRTIEQGITLAGIKISEEAREATGVCFMDPNDMDTLRLVANQNIEVKTSVGKIVVKAKESSDAPHKGIIFIPLGIYANWIIPTGKAGIGVPRFKGVKATIRKTKKSVPKVEDLIAKLLVEKNKEK
ncbi:MAG: tRNA CCA-pyrophosphorylase [Candidatus Heimdallarchaeota archaeon]|nr:tRNA CCA-pyrophosphorylase [Candidatus Heimdallarchaeota archaeon]